MTFLVCLWSIRLTYNYFRKGGFKPGGEDYRWAHIHKKLGPVWFQVLNFTFIAPGQLLIVWLFTAPIHQAWLIADKSLSWLDAVATLLFVIFWIGEAVADQQMWRFQEAKKTRYARGETVLEPFFTSGLFRFCRHPNFICELGMWWVFYVFAVSATSELINWSGVGFIALTGIFIGSTRLSETISLMRYPSYSDYQASTPRLIPFTRLGCINLKGKFSV